MTVSKHDNLSEHGPENDLWYEFNLAVNYLRIPVMAEGGRGPPILVKASMKAPGN